VFVIHQVDCGLFSADLAAAIRRVQTAFTDLRRTCARLCHASGGRVGADPIPLGACFGSNDGALPWVANSGFDLPSMIALASSRILEPVARLWKDCRPYTKETIKAVCRGCNGDLATVDPPTSSVLRGKPFAYSSSLTTSPTTLSILLRLTMRRVSKANIHSTNYCTRLRSIIQSVSHVFPPSGDSACSQ
jgi:hypothetical protein